MGRHPRRKAKEDFPELKSEKISLGLDAWQFEVLNTPGNKVICSGRQTGKSTVVSILASDKAVSQEKKQILIVSVTEDQAKELLTKCLFYLEDNYHSMISTGIDRPTKDTIRLKNGSIIRTRAVGMSGRGVRGFTIDMLIADEAAFMPEDVWAAVTPMLLTTGGDIILVSTPYGRKNFFYKCYNDPQFKVWHIDTIKTINDRAISPTWLQIQRDKAIEYLKSEEYRLSEKEFAQEYKGLFIEDTAQFFDDIYLKRSLIQQKTDYTINESIDFYIGVDIGRLGGDKTVFTIFEKRGELMIQREMVIWKETYLDQIAQQIIDWDSKFHFRRIFLDNGGIGIGVFDILYNTPNFKRRVKGINNAEKIVEYDQNGQEKRSKLMKEEIYTNLMFMMAKGKILLFDDGDIWLSLKSTQYEYLNQRGGAMMKIDHPDHRQSHIVESIARAAIAGREKINKFHIYSI